jgi:DNA gyrase/topoisomerase IV subunit B
MAKKTSAKPENAKQIIALDDHEHARLKSTMWVGSIEPSQETLALVKNNLLVAESKIISVGFYKLMNEIVDNAFDEAKGLLSKT